MQKTARISKKIRAGSDLLYTTKIPTTAVVKKEEKKIFIFSNAQHSLIENQKVFLQNPYRNSSIEKRKN